MGNSCFFSFCEPERIFFWKPKSSAKVWMIGLRSGGKTSLLYRLKLNEVVTTAPTIGYNVEDFEYKHFTITCFDVTVSMLEKYRQLWRHYFKEMSALIWMVDSKDRKQIEESKEWLFQILESEEFKGNHLLILANKQDLPDSMSVGEVQEQLELENINRNILWHIQGCCVTSGEGINEGLDWLISSIEGKEENSIVLQPHITKNIKSAKNSSSENVP